MLDVNYKIKSLPHDFIVNEKLNPEAYAVVSSSGFYLYEMQKIGLSTFDSIHKLAQYFNICPTTIGYSGLKDEDGITSQYITLLFLTEKTEYNFDNLCDFSNKSLINLKYLHPVESPLKIRSLMGNHFILNVRGLNKTIFNKITLQNEHTVHYINYYDTQRFGTPNSPKNTHIIGQHLINKNFHDALIVLKTQNNVLATQARAFRGLEPQLFFANIEKRQLAFFYSSYFSFCWNALVNKMILKNTRSNKCIIRENIEYWFVNQQDELANLLMQHPKLPYTKPHIEDNELLFAQGERSVVNKTSIEVIDSGKDTLYEGRYYVQLSFFLPMGSYATMLIAQFMDKYSDVN